MNDTSAAGTTASGPLLRRPPPRTDPELGQQTTVLVEQVGAVDVTPLGDLVGHLRPEEQWGIDTALSTVLDLR